MASIAAQVVSHLRWVFVDKMPPGSPEFGMLVLPIISYWVVACFYDAIDALDLPLTRRYRVVRKARGRENAITKAHVIRRVLLQHAIQFMLTYVVFVLDPDQCAANPAKGWAGSALQFGIGMLLMDTWQFWIHRFAHVNTYLYKHVHSHHHRLLIPYAYGALYNHPLEALLLDTLGGVVTLYGSGMSCEVGSWFMNFATIKTVLDHSGYLFPVNPLHDLFPNSAAFHDVHHDIRNIKKNYSQPFFTHWDWIMGSFKSPVGFHYPAGSEEAAANSHAAAVQPDAGKAAVQPDASKAVGSGSSSRRESQESRESESRKDK